jgi:hypothetical protein
VQMVPPPATRCNRYPSIAALKGGEPTLMLQAEGEQQQFGWDSNWFDQALAHLQVC